VTRIHTWFVTHIHGLQLYITILAWPAFLGVIYLLEHKDMWSRRVVCMAMAAARF